MGMFIILVLADLFLWWRLLSDIRDRRSVAFVSVMAAKGLLTALLLWLITGLVFYRGEFAAPANAFRYIVFGTVAALTVTIAISWPLITLIVRLTGRFLHRKLDGVVWVNILFAGILTVIFADSFFRQRFDVRIIRREIKVDRLDPRLEGMKLVLISDLHLSSYHGQYKRLEKVIETVNSLQPDMLFNTGDFITYGWQEFGECDTILKKARSAPGSFAIVGNHDDGTYYPGYDDAYGAECARMIESKVAASGYTMLNDSSVTVTFNGAPIRVAGVVTHGHRLDMRYGDFEKALAGPDSVALKILMVHDPAAWDTVQTFPGKADLVLSGHTHGMQIGLPTPWGRISPASIFHKYWGGHYEFSGTDLVVTTGLGTMGMAGRIFMPPEIVLMTLTSE
ncbi:MAG TPA: metallophosphoesterase [Bacteroidales bacterium]|nr:metallophosphoesterase [Bacteroidales bacterium]